MFASLAPKIVPIACIGAVTKMSPARSVKTGSTRPVPKTMFRDVHPVTSKVARFANLPLQYLFAQSALRIILSSTEHA